MHYEEELHVLACRIDREEKAHGETRVYYSLLRQYEEIMDRWAEAERRAEWISECFGPDFGEPPAQDAGGL